MTALPRLRQVALVAAELAPVVDRLRSELGVAEGWADPGIDVFGLENRVFPIGDTFLEVVSPVREGTTAGRYLERRGGDGGYMALFQVADTVVARERVARLGIRIVWEGDQKNISGTHLHPKDVPGAIVSLDTPSPEGSWAWAGPDWDGQVPDHGPESIVGVTVQAEDPVAVAAQWATVLDEIAKDMDGTPTLVLDSGRQTVRFVAVADGRGEGISSVTVALSDDVRAGRESVDVCGVRFELVPVEG